MSSATHPELAQRTQSMVELASSRVRRYPPSMIMDSVGPAGVLANGSDVTLRRRRL
jgi:hypothetical protein